MSSQPGRRKKRFLAPQEKYEIWMQVVRGDTTVADAAEAARVDRSTIAKLRDVARQGALDALAQSRPGRREALSLASVMGPPFRQWHGTGSGSSASAG